MRPVYLLLIISTLLLTGSCLSIPPQPTAQAVNQDASLVVTFPKKGQKIKAVAVIVHGLNLKPERMDDWSLELSGRGAIALRVALSGHRGDILEMRNASPSVWRSDLDQAIAQARVYAKKYKVPVVFLGYSLGGLIGVDWLTRQNGTALLFDKVVLLAPAIATAWHASVAEKLLVHLSGPMIVFTPNPAEFRANWGSSVNAYKSLFTLKSDVEKLSYKNANVDTLVLTDRFDELIPFEGLRSIITQYRLSRWKLENINNEYAKLNHGFRHLIADRYSVGTEGWRELTIRVVKHFNL